MVCAKKSFGNRVYKVWVEKYPKVRIQTTKEPATFVGPIKVQLTLNFAPTFMCGEYQNNMWMMHFLMLHMATRKIAVDRREREEQEARERRRREEAAAARRAADTIRNNNASFGSGFGGGFSSGGGFRGGW